jgi:hypothetical protein
MISRRCSGWVLCSNDRTYIFRGGVLVCLRAEVDFDFPFSPRLAGAMRHRMEYVLLAVGRTFLAWQYGRDFHWHMKKKKI